MHYSYKWLIAASLVLNAVSGLSIHRVDGKAPAKTDSKIRPLFDNLADSKSHSEKCQCVDLKKCEEANIYKATGQEQVHCEVSYHVCCIQHPVQETHPTKQEGTEPACTCVPLDKCPKEAYSTDYGAGVIITRISPCDVSEVCCSNDYLHPKKKETPPVTEHSWAPCQHTSEIHHEVKGSDTGFSNGETLSGGHHTAPVSESIHPDTVSGGHQLASLPETIHSDSVSGAHHTGPKPESTHSDSVSGGHHTSLVSESIQSGSVSGGHHTAPVPESTHSDSMSGGHHTAPVPESTPSGSVNGGHHTAFVTESTHSDSVSGGHHTAFVPESTHSDSVSGGHHTTPVLESANSDTVAHTAPHILPVPLDAGSQAKEPSLPSYSSPLPVDIGSESSDPDCACAPIDLCTNSAVEYEHGAGVLQIRSPFCDVSEVCCSLDNLLSTLKVPTPNVVENVPPVSLPHEAHEYQCGIRKISAVRITGVDAPAVSSFGEFPWMVMILKTGNEYEEHKMICGGSLLSDNVVLTAAHCVSSVPKEKLILRAGEYDITIEAEKEEAPHQDRHVHEIVIHPFYKSEVVFNDVALLIVETPFKLKSHVSPICLPYIGSKFHDPKLYDWHKCIATGWGKDAHGTLGTHQHILNKIELPLVERTECQKRLRETRLGPRFKLHSSFICAGGEEGKDTCQGDGGGPLFCPLNENPDRYLQVGIVSWGLECGTKYPAVYSSVYANAKWLTYEFQHATGSSYNFTDGYWKESHLDAPK